MKRGNSMRNMRILTTCVLLLCANSAQSAVVHLEGNTVDFYYDDAQPGMAAYGELTVVGDSIFATPTDFLAEASGVAGAGSFSSSGTVTVVLKSGYQFDAVAVAQQGDYQLTGTGAGVTVDSDLTVVDSSNVATIETNTMINAGLGINDGDLHEWSSFGQFDLSTVAWDSVTSIDLNLDTILTASTSAAGEYALIQNKYVGGGLITIETTEVPVPASVWLFVSGFLGLLGVVRRKH